MTRLNYYFFIAIIFMSCQAEEGNKTGTSTKIPLEGTWKLLSATTIKGDSITVDSLEGKKMFKVINETHFTFTNYSLEDQQCNYISGGGTYRLKGDQYTENIEFCNFGWEGKSLTFTVRIENDTLIQQGREELADLDVNHEVIEKYVRVY